PAQAKPLPYDMGDATPRPSRKLRSGGREAGLETYRIEVGHQHGVKPGNIVGAIANEAQLDSQNIGRIEIFDDHSLVDLPEGMPKETFRDLQKVWVCGQQLRISRLDTAQFAARTKSPREDRPGKPRHRGPSIRG
ncbi:MAG: DbpA RNA binding domain-containing protein, partial [Hydrocarboniphaga effusa]|nr:DbpA RNA binding domain-containing protein [Hydrocarboniphaga effusa]